MVLEKIVTFEPIRSSFVAISNHLFVDSGDRSIQIYGTDVSVNKREPLPRA